MIISKKDREYLKRHVKGAAELIENDRVGDLLVLLEDVLIEDEISHEDVLSSKGKHLQRIYDAIDADNPD